MILSIFPCHYLKIFRYGRAVRDSASSRFTGFLKAATAMNQPIQPIFTPAHTLMYPWHFLNDGSKTDSIDLAQMIGAALVVWLPGVKRITPDVLESIMLPRGTVRLLFRTDNSHLWAQGVREFKKDFVALTVEAAEWLAKAGIGLVGIDYLSIQLFEDSSRTHEALLEVGIVILEGLNLHDIEPGSYELICLPLAVCGAEGAPARAVLRK